MKIVWVSDFDLRGSGYRNISVPICNELTRRGHEIISPALNYQGQEHFENFTMIPAKSLREVAAITQNLVNLWGFDYFVMAMDIPVHEQLLSVINPNKPFKYVGIMPIEANPLCQSWGMVLMQMDKRFFISQFATDEAAKAGVDGTHLEVGIDISAWKLATDKEKFPLRESLGIPKEAFVVLTVADNQERKHLSAGMEIVSKFKAVNPDVDVYYLLITRENNPAGWKLRDLAQFFGINDKTMIFERGMSHPQLWSMYAVSDVFLLPSKAEGLGMPLLEAMAVGIPCVGTDCTGIRELLSNDRGVLIPPAYKYIDPFGNGYRYFIDTEIAAEELSFIRYNEFDKSIKEMISNAREFVEHRTWENATNILELELMKGLQP
jgi:glycosyltransferase involved in cell wall biosynthesis